MPSQIIGSKGQRIYEAADGAAAGAGGGGAAIVITDNRTSGGAGYVTVSSGSLVLAGGNNITLSQDGSSVTISGGAGAGGLGAGISTLGNTSGDTGFVTGRLIFAGLGAVTLSGSTNGASMSISMSAPAQTTQTQGIGSLGISGGNTAGDTGTHTLGRLVFAGGSNVTLSGSSNGVSRTISIAAADQTVQTQGGFASMGISGGNTAGDTGLATRQRVVFAGHSNITLSGSTNGASLTISASVADQTVQTQGGFASIGISGGNTQGDTGAATRARVVFAGGNSITLSGSTNGASHTITIVGPSQSVQTQGGFASIGISGGNTAGDTGAATRDRLVFAGAGIITLSGSTNGGSHTISISAGAGGSSLSVGISNGGNTAGDTGTVQANRIIIQGTNNITVSGSTNGSSVTFSISGKDQTVQTQGGFASLGISGGNTAGDTGAATRDRLVFAGGNNVTLSGSTNGGSHTISIVGATLTNSSFSAGISGGNTAGDTGTQSGRLVFAGGNSITLSGSSSNNGNQTISIVGPTITQSSYSAGISGGNTAGDTGTQTGRLVLAGGANITLSGSSSNNGNQTITIVGPSPGAGFAGGGISGGNTAGDTGSVTGRLIFAGGAAITLSGSTNGGSQTISIVGSAQSVQTQGIPILGISGGNTAGDTGASSGTKLVFAGGANITLSGSTAANATTISVVGGAGGGGITGALSNLGNTTGDTGAQALSRLVFVGGDNITLSGSTGANSQTVTIMGQPYRRLWHNDSHNQTANIVLGNSTSLMNPVILPYPLQVDFARLYFVATTSSGAPFATTANSTFTAEARQTLRIDLFTRGTGANSMSLQAVTSGSGGLTEQWSCAQGAASANMTASYRVTYPFRTGTSSFSTSTVVSSASWQMSGFTSVWWSRNSSNVMMDIPFGTGNASIAEGPVWVMFGISTAQATQIANATALANNSIGYRPTVMQSPVLAIHRPYEVTNASVQMFPGAGSFSTVGGATTASLNFSNISSINTFPIMPMAFMADIDA